MVLLQCSCRLLLRYSCTSEPLWQRPNTAGAMVPRAYPNKQQQDAKFHRGPSFTSIHSFLILSTNYIRSPLHCKKKRLSDISSNKFSPQRSRIIFNFVFNRKQEQQVSMLAHGQGNCGYELFFTARYVPSIPPHPHSISSLHRLQASFS